jgi:nucleolar protein 12
VLALPEEKLKYNKRKLRVQRCKTLPGKPKPTPGDTSAKDAAAAAAAALKYQDPRKTHPNNTSKPLPLPKGNPLLGEQIKDLSKDERKVAKATDADRLARRMAKKKARVTMDKQGGPANKRESVKLGSFGGKNAKGKTDLKAKKSRTRSEHAATGRNKKKA